MQDDTLRAEQDALDVLAEANTQLDEGRMDFALDVLRAAQNAHDAAILCRIEAEREHRQWWDRERAPGVPHSIQERQSA